MILIKKIIFIKTLIVLFLIPLAIGYYYTIFLNEKELVINSQVIIFIFVYIVLWAVGACLYFIIKCAKLIEQNMILTRNLDCKIEKFSTNNGNEHQELFVTQ